MRFLTLSVIFFAFIQASYSSTYDYGLNGPDTWFIKYPACDDTMQSPINIDSRKVTYDCKLAPIEFINYKMLPFNMKITEHNVEFVQDISKYTPVMKVAGSNFGYHEFEFVNGHFHWGFNDFQGSEHTVDDMKYPLEMHLVHRLKEEQDPENLALVVLGVFFELSEYDNPLLDDIIANIKFLNNNNDEEVKLEINVLDILPNNLHYYRYDGSLTTPPCVEVVTWSVMRDTIKISSEQLHVFRELELLKNFRDPQPLNCRNVYSSFKPHVPYECPNTKKYNHIFAIYNEANDYSHYEKY